MGAAISLRFALEERFSALRDSIASIVSSGRSSSRRSRSDSRHSAQDSTRSGTSPQQDSKRCSKEWIPKARAEDGTARKAGMTNVVEVVLEDPALAASPPQSPLSSQTSPKPIPSKSRNMYGTPWSVVTCKFVVGQMVFNAISSIGCSILLFYILFVLFVVPPGEPLLLYSWTHPNLIGVVLGSVLLVSPTLVMLLAPAGLPEAVDKGWFRVVRYSDCPQWLTTVFPFLGPHPRWRRGMLRHVMLGLTLSIVYVPVPLLLARFVVANAEGSMTTWTLIVFNTTFETLLALPCTALGLLGFAMQPNYERTLEVMSTPGATQKHPVKRLINRVFCGCLRLLW